MTAPTRNPKLAELPDDLLLRRQDGSGEVRRLRALEEWCAARAFRPTWLDLDTERRHRQAVDVSTPAHPRARQRRTTNATTDPTRRSPL